jgi:hypothetical protein
VPQKKKKKKKGERKEKVIEDLAQWQTQGQVWSPASWGEKRERI